MSQAAVAGGTEGKERSITPLQT